MDLSGDWQLIDDPLTLTYASRTAEGTWAAGASVTYCQRNAVTKEDIEKHKSLLGQKSTVFHLWTAKLSGIVPKVKDKITHGGRTYAVLEVEEMDRDSSGVQRYRALCNEVSS